MEEPFRPGSRSPSIASDSGIIDTKEDKTSEKKVKEPPAKGKSKSGFKLCCTGFIGTRQLTSETDRKSYIRATLWELIIYIVYLTVCCIVAYGSVSSSGYYYTKILSDLFLDNPFQDESITFRTSTTVIDFWKFTEKVLLDGLYWEDWYQDDTLHQPVELKDQGILYENRILGRPRLRQIRVKNSECPISPVFRNLLDNNKECYPHYDSENEDNGLYNDTVQTGTAWKYHKESELQGRSYWGELATYSGGGAYLLLGLKRADTKIQIEDLKKNEWIKRATRVVFLEFSVYNANINQFCIVKLAWEFSPTGGMVTSWSFRNMKLFRYNTNWEFFVLACEIFFIIFTIYYTVQEEIEIYSLGIIKYLSDIWSYLDLLILSISYVCIVFSLYRLQLVLNTIQPLLVSSFSNTNKFSDFEFLGFWESQFINGIAICLFFSWVKIFKYISFNQTMSQLSTTLSRCAKDILGFAIMFFIVFFAFAQLGYLLFGSQVRNFSSFHDSVFSLLRLILGDFEFREIEAANRVLGPIYYLAYVFLVFFVLLNMFLAIINDTYSEVKAEIQAQRDQFQITDYIRQKFRFLGGAFRRGKPVEDDLYLDGASADGKITQIELKNHLIKANYSNEEVDIFLGRYALDKDIPLDEEETEQVITELEGKQNSEENDYMGGDGKAHNEITEDERMDHRITAMEVSLTNLIGKLDKIMSKIPDA